LLVFVALLSGWPRCSDALDAPAAPLPYTVGGQTTVVWQYHPRFHSPYEGSESLHHEHDDAVSHSYDLYVGVRVLPWLDLYVNPEMIRGGGADRGPVSVIGVRLHFEGAVGHAWAPQRTARAMAAVATTARA